MTTRRGFFRLLAGAAALSAVPPSVMASVIEAEVPTFWCDGIGDDGPAFTALMRGDVVRFARPELAEGVGWMDDVLYLGNLRMTSPDAFVITGNVCGGRDFEIRNGYWRSESPVTTIHIDLPAQDVTILDSALMGIGAHHMTWSAASLWVPAIHSAEIIKPPSSMWGWGADSAETRAPFPPPKPPKKPKALRGRI